LKNLYSWLKSNASKYGFTQSFPESAGDRFEQWHWRYDGTIPGKKLIDSYILSETSSNSSNTQSTDQKCKCIEKVESEAEDVDNSTTALLDWVNIFKPVTANAETKKLDLAKIANDSKNQAHSIIVQTVEDGKYQGYNSDQPPASVASTIKSVVVVVVIEEELKKRNIGIDTEFTIPKELEGDGENRAGRITVRRAIELMLSESSNTTTNGLVYYFGGGSNPNSNEPKERFTKLMNDYGFSTMRFSKYMNINNGRGTVAEQATTPRLPPNRGTAGDVAKATYKVFQDEQRYSIAADSLKTAVDQFKIGSIAISNGFKDIARKWGGTSQVTANVGVYELGGVKYVIGVYINADQSGSGAQRLKNTFEDIFKALKDGAAVDPTSTTSTSSTPLVNCSTEENSNSNDNISKESTPSMIKMLEYARSRSAGKRPDGRCLWHVNNWIDAIGYGKIPRPAVRLSEAYMYGNWLQANGKKYGITNLLDKNPNLSPYDAPAGALVVVSAGSPGTGHPTAGDIAVADGNGKFYNGGEMNYQGKGAWKGNVGIDRDGSRGRVIGIFVADQ
jgi:Beta-lactamase enzyme family/D-alanyl-D-alanine carboxypeptidase